MPGRITRYRFLYIMVMILDTAAELKFKYTNTIMGNYRFGGLEHEKNLAFGRILLNNCGNNHNLT